MGRQDSSASVPDSVDPYAALEPMTEAEYGALKADIASRGILVPIEVDEAGNILDGHHRAKAWAELGHPAADIPKIQRDFASQRDKLRHILALNVCRRHLSRPKRTHWLFEYEQLTLPTGSAKTVHRFVPRLKTAPSAAPEHATERQRSHRLRERLRPKQAVSAFTDPWELAAEVVTRLEAMRPALASSAHFALELEACIEMTKQLAWGPE